VFFQGVKTLIYELADAREADVLSAICIRLSADGGSPALAAETSNRIDWGCRIKYEPGTPKNWKMVSNHSKSQYWSRQQRKSFAEFQTPFQDSKLPMGQQIIFSNYICTILGRNYKIYDDGLPATRATGPDPDPTPLPPCFVSTASYISHGTPLPDRQDTFRTSASSSCL